MEPSPASSIEKMFEELLRDGIAAARHGEVTLARSLLERAVQLKVGDARPWLWLSRLTDDPTEQRKYLEFAVAAEPHNEGARRQLVLLSDKLDRSRLVPQGETVTQQRPTEPLEVNGQSVQCSQCGGRMSFNPQVASLICSYCGNIQPVDANLAADSAEQVLDFVMPTTRAHRWAEARKLVTCQSCGAVVMLDPGHLVSRCSYCGSNHLLDCPEMEELLEPQVIGLVALDAETAHRHVRTWLGKSIFTPDNLMQDAHDFDLRLAYYPFWTFDGTLELPWSCEVNVGSPRNPQWVGRSGSEYQFYDDVLIPGFSGLEQAEVEAIEPFLLKELVEFKPEQLAGWPAINYDRPVANAFLMARERVSTQVRQRLHLFIEPGREKRNIRSGGGRWSGTTFKYALLPLWVGTYQFHGKPYHLLVNGQTGKVSGTRPRDDLKIFLLALGVLLLLMLVGMLIYWLWAST
jgi:predicted RNA-binding Zn-ribbon protein involved in translation (DUF1610 family)